MGEQGRGRESDCHCDIGQVSSLFWALIGHERTGLDNLQSLGWRAAEVGEGDPICSGVEYLAVEGGEEGDVRMKLLCGILKSLVI